MKALINKQQQLGVLRIKLNSAKISKAGYPANEKNMPAINKLDEEIALYQKLIADAERSEE